MKGFAQFMARVPLEYVPKIENAVSRAVDVLSDPAAPSDAYQSVADELDDIQRTVGADAADALRKELIEQMAKRLCLRGMSELEAKELITNRVTELVRRIERARGAARHVKVDSPFSKLKVATLCVLSIVGLGLMAAVVTSNFRSGRAVSNASDQEVAVSTLQRSVAENAANEEIMRRDGNPSAPVVEISGDDFRAATLALESGVATAQPALQAALPQEVQFAASIPVTVTVQPTMGPTQTLRTTVGNVFSASPQPVRRAIIQAISMQKRTWNKTIFFTSPVGGFSVSGFH